MPTVQERIAAARGRMKAKGVKPKQITNKGLKAFTKAANRQTGKWCSGQGRDVQARKKGTALGSRACKKK
jgi:hypothetical protein